MTRLPTAARAARPLLVAAAAMLAVSCNPGSVELGGDSGDDAQSADTDTAGDSGAGDRQAGDSRTGDSAGDSQVGAGDTDIAGLLGGIADLTVTELPGALTGFRVFAATIDQPLDHATPTGPRFDQRIRILHRNGAAPTVLYGTGYGLPGSPEAIDVTDIVAGNQITVEHRFFGTSIPTSPDWSDLNIVDAAGDYHRIITLLAPVYPGVWLCAGGSKGGMAAVYHRRFFPNDVAGTIAYVTPQSLGRSDSRYVTFLEQVGTTVCRGALATLTRELLARAPAMRQRLLDMETAGSQSFAHLGRTKALEHAVIELPFSFWQFYGPSWCATIPAATATDDQLFTYLDAVVWLPNFADSGIAGNEPYFHQSATELGYPAPFEAPVSDLLTLPGTYIAEAYVMHGQPISFDATVMPDIASWIATAGDRLLLIYGGVDPWSAGAIDLGAASDSFLYTVTDGTHAVRVDALPQPQRDEARATITRWAQ